jgi:hypothetical protein
MGASPGGPGVEPPAVVVVGETPSLGRALVELFEADEIRSRLVAPPDPPDRWEELLATRPLLVVACSGLYCATARSWLRGELPVQHLVVVGARDPFVARASGLHHVPIPVSAGPLLELVRGLLGSPPVDRGSRPSGPPSTDGAR